MGDGNINYVYIVEGPSGGLVVKQGLPFIRIARNWALTQVAPLTRASPRWPGMSAALVQSDVLIKILLCQERYNAMHGAPALCIFCLGCLAARQGRAPGLTGVCVRSHRKQNAMW